MKDILYIVVPCYNEEEVLPSTAQQLEEVLSSLKKAGEIAAQSRVLLVDDGSKDSTWSIIEELYTKQGDCFAGLKLSRNRGHQNALLAGLLTAKEAADMVISIDADLQDDPIIIPDFVAEYKKGNDIVYGVRKDRSSDSRFKRMTAQGFYKLMKLLGVDIIYNHADCRLLSKRALNALAQYEEVHLFLRGVVPLIGFPSSQVEYRRNPRLAGESKYPLGRMLSFAWEGISSFSVRPLRMIGVLGTAVCMMSLVLIVYSLIRNYIGQTVPGWSSLMISVWLLGGVQILCISVVGEYIGKMYSEVKKRPKYIIERLLDTNQPEQEEE